MGFARILFILFGTVLIIFNVTTFKSALLYYFKPGSQEQELHFLKLEHSQVISVVLLNLGLSIVIASILPESGSTFTVELPTSLVDAIGLFSLGAVAEEMIFRILPWALIFAFREKTNRSKASEVINIVSALAIGIVFGILHAYNYDSPDVWAYIRTASHTVNGLVYWYLLEKNGLFSSSVAHFCYNMCVWFMVTRGL